MAEPTALVGPEKVTGALRRAVSRVRSIGGGPPLHEPATGLAAVIERVVLHPEVDVAKLEKVIELQERILRGSLPVGIPGGGHAGPARRTSGGLGTPTRTNRATTTRSPRWIEAGMTRRRRCVSARSIPSGGAWRWIGRPRRWPRSSPTPRRGRRCGTWPPRSCTSTTRRSTGAGRCRRLTASCSRTPAGSGRGDVRDLCGAGGRGSRRGACRPADL